MMAVSSAARKVKVLASILAGILFGCSLGGAIVVILATQFFGFHVLAVQSPSMTPAIDKGDLVVTRPTGASGLHKGDIIYFVDSEGLPTIHRIVVRNEITLNANTPDGKFLGSRTDFQFVTKGDANPAIDGGDVTAKQIKGKLWFVIPGLGSLAGGGGLQLLLLGIAAVVAVLWLAMEFGSRLGRKRGASDTGPAGFDGDWSPESPLPQPVAPPEGAPQEPTTERLGHHT